jgi:hypothetical protein
LLAIYPLKGKRISPLSEAVKQLQDARYIAVEDHNEYINLIEDIATELA